MDQDLADFKNQLLQLEELRAAGALGAEQYDAQKAQLERNILDCVMGQPPAPARKHPRPVWHWLALLAILLLIAAAVVYGVKRSKASGVAAGPTSSVPHALGTPQPHAASADQMGSMIDKLAARLKDKPDDAAGWAMLARSYGALGRADEAVAAYAKAAALSKDDAGLLADYADALAVKNNRVLSGEPMKLIARALVLDPRNVKALAIAGSDAFERKDYPAAVKYWDQVVALGGPGNLFAQQIQPSLTQARQAVAAPPSAPVSPKRQP